MSAYTRVDHEDVSRLMATVRSAGGEELGDILSVECVGEGCSNSVYLVRTTVSTYILKLIEPSIDGLAEASAEQRHLIQRDCHRRGMRVPEPVGELVEFKGKKAQFMHRVDGISLGAIQPWQARVLGRRTAEFQLGLQGLEGLCPRRRVNPARLLVGEVLASARRATGPRKLSELSYLLSVFDLSVAFIRTRKELELKRVPKGITHADLNRGNILFTRDGADIAAFLDFDSIAVGFLLRDLVKLIYEYGVSLESDGRYKIDKDVTIALIEGYSDARRLSRAELESIEAVLEMTSRWQASSHQKLHLVGRNREDATAIDQKNAVIRSSRHKITRWLRDIKML
jgi:Ser/Thr protein kinase RdoA (MazF antagonist)